MTTFLIDLQLIRVGQEYSSALARLDDMQSRHNKEVAELKRKISAADSLNSSNATALASMETQERDLLALLAVYQSKIQNMVEITRLLSQSESDLMRRVSSLELEVAQQKVLLDSQKETIDSLRQARSHSDNLLKEVSMIRAIT